MKPLAERQFDSCCSKVRYFTRERAALVAGSIYMQKQIALRVYQCDFCRNFHLTSKV